MIELVYETLFDVYNERIAYMLTWKEGKFSFCFVFHRRCIEREVEFLWKMCGWTNIMSDVNFFHCFVYLSEALCERGVVLQIESDLFLWKCAMKWKMNPGVQYLFDFVWHFWSFLFQTALNFVVFLITYKKQREMKYLWELVRQSWVNKLWIIWTKKLLNFILRSIKIWLEELHFVVWFE